MLRIAQHQLKRVLAGRQLDTGLGLARAEMNMVLVLWNRLVRIQRFVHIDQQMMMTAVLKIVAGVGDAHSAQTETTPEAAFHRSPVLRPNEIKKRVLCRRLSLSLDGARHGRQRRGEHNKPDDPHCTSREISRRESYSKSM